MEHSLGHAVAARDGRDNRLWCMQVSFLHTYHHVLMMWAWLYVCKVECGGDAWFGAAINSLVHVVMYAYYFLSQLGVPCPWKRYLTMMQMCQFCMCMAQSAYVMWRGNAPLGLVLVQAFVMINMLVLFGQFYRKSYGADGRVKAAKSS
jgi:elongation of very long chain fatty acids protein 4